MATVVAGTRTPHRRHTLRSFGSGARALRVSNKVALGLLGFIVVLSIAGPWLAPHDPIARVGQPFLAPGHGGFVLGTDESGRDLLSRLLYGLRSSWWSAVGVVGIAVLAGAVIGTIAGSAGGWLDALLMRITDVFLAMPGTLLAIAVVAAFGPSLQHTLIAVAVVWWPWYARIVRNEVWALSARPFIDAAKLAGVGRVRRGARHLLPGVAGPLLVTAALDIGALLVVLSGLSFFGLGAAPPSPELGSMTARGLNYIFEFWWIPVVPAIGVAVLAFVANLSGEAARSILDERS
jgi:peptide/nickel transport system permease protein